MVSTRGGRQAALLCTGARIAWCNTEMLFIAEDEEEKNLRRISYLQATKEERMEVEEK